MRRLSGSGLTAIATDVLLGNESSGSGAGKMQNGASNGTTGNGKKKDGSARLILRPLSVQERIRELNLRARHFAETVMAVQLQDVQTNSRNFAPIGNVGGWLQ